MTHNDIYIKYMIEYDKANVTSSYPALTEYEIATILDKAYNALIAQKITGNNIRRTGFESDIKSISDLQPLIKEYKTYDSNFSMTGNSNTDFGYSDVTNSQWIKLPTDFLYFVNCRMKVKKDANNRISTPIKLLTHQMAEKFFETPYNKPWIKQPICYIEDNKMFIVYDSQIVHDSQYGSPDLLIRLSYIKTPNSFINNLKDSGTKFECNDTIAEELISLAITFALENVESPRLNSKLNTKGLEA